MAREKQIGRFLPVIGIGLLLVITGIVWSDKQVEPASRTIEFKNKSFDVFTVGDNSKIVFGYADSTGNQLNTFAKFKDHLAQSKHDLIFAVNGGMFTKTYQPLGLYINKGLEISPLRLDSGYGNFYLKPNGVFGLYQNGDAFVQETMEYDRSQNKSYTRVATQSGPLLVIDGKLHPALTDGSKNVHIRNGVGINKDGKVVFVISNQKTNFYDFASLFKEILECDNALYLDGAISKMFNEETNRNEDGRFGVMIGVVK